MEMQMVLDDWFVQTRVQTMTTSYVWWLCLLGPFYSFKNSPCPYVTPLICGRNWGTCPAECLLVWI